MTHSGGKPHKVGDNGQRYEVRAIGWPSKGEDVVAWADNLGSAKARADVTLLAPSCMKAWVVDREDNRTVVFTVERENKPEKCGPCSGTGRYMGRFGFNDPDCPSCDGSGWEDGQRRHPVTGKIVRPFAPGGASR